MRVPRLRVNHAVVLHRACPSPQARAGLPSADGERRAEPPRREVVGYPPLSELGDLQGREFHEALLDADGFEDLPGKWQAAIVAAEQNLPNLRLIQ